MEAYCQRQSLQLGQIDFLSNGQRSFLNVIMRMIIAIFTHRGLNNLWLSGFVTLKPRTSSIWKTMMWSMLHSPILEKIKQTLHWLSRKYAQIHTLSLGKPKIKPARTCVPTRPQVPHAPAILSHKTHDSIVYLNNQRHAMHKVLLIICLVPRPPMTSLHAVSAWIQSLARAKGNSLKDVATCFIRPVSTPFTKMVGEPARTAGILQKTWRQLPPSQTPNRNVFRHCSRSKEPHTKMNCSASRAKIGNLVAVNSLLLWLRAVLHETVRITRFGKWLNPLLIHTINEW